MGFRVMTEQQATWDNVVSGNDFLMNHLHKHGSVNAEIYRNPFLPLVRVDDVPKPENNFLTFRMTKEYNDLEQMMRVRVECEGVVVFDDVFYKPHKMRARP